MIPRRPSAGEALSTRFLLSVVLGGQFFFGKHCFVAGKVGIYYRRRGTDQTHEHSGKHAGVGSDKVPGNAGANILLSQQSAIFHIPEIIAGRGGF